MIFPTKRTITCFKALSFIIIIIGLVLSSYPVKADMDASSLFVTPSGSDANGCTTPAQPCLTIDGAIAKATAGDTVYVAAGTYTSDQIAVVTIDMQINLSGGWDPSFASRTGYSTLEKTENNQGNPLMGIEILASGTASADRFIIQNFKGGYGGAHGIRNWGTFTLTNSFVQNNYGIDGAGVYNLGVLTVEGSSFEDNYSYNNGAGIYNHIGATLYLVDSHISNNLADSFGGAIYNGDTGEANIKNITITNNQADYGGGVYNNSGNTSITDSQINNNTASSSGGGIYGFGTLTITKSTIADNTSGESGGGIRFGGDVTITNSTISGNITKKQNPAQFTDYFEYGGGISSFGDTVTLINSVVKDNQSNDPGGGIHVQDGVINIINTTVSNNTSSADGGGIYVDLFTGVPGILNSYNSTISQNKSISGGGISSIGTTNLKNSILSGNSADSGADCAGTVTSAGYNLIGDTTDCTFQAAGGDQQNVDPEIGNLVNGLGYYTLASSSPAINAGDPAGCTDSLGNPITTDQRGAARVDRCDIGSYEYISPGLPQDIVPLTGDGQRAPLFAELPVPLSAIVVDSIGSPVPDVDLTFTAPDTGPSVFFSDTDTNTTSITTDSWGVAADPHAAANEFCGTYSILGSSGDINSIDVFSITNYSLAFIPVAINRYCGNFFDDFGSTTSGWPVGEDAYLKTAYVNGEYQVKSKSDNYMYLIKAPICERQNYILETDVRWVGEPGSSYGLLFGIEGNLDKYYVFEVNTDYKIARLYYIANNQYHELLSERFSSAIRMGGSQNHLAITVSENQSGLHLTPYINQISLGTWEYNLSIGLSDVGITTTPYNGSSPSDARFDNFRVTNIVTETSLTAEIQAVDQTLDGIDVPVPDFDWQLPENWIIR